MLTQKLNKSRNVDNWPVHTLRLKKQRGFDSQSIVKFNMLWL